MSNNQSAKLFAIAAIVESTRAALHTFTKTTDAETNEHVNECAIALAKVADKIRGIGNRQLELFP